MENAVPTGRGRGSPTAAAVTVAAFVCYVFSGCGVRGVQVPQSPLLRFFERASGMIAYVGLDGNVRLVDQNAAHAAAVTRDAGQTQDGAVAYGLPTWALDGKSIAFPGCRQAAEGDEITAWTRLADRTGHDSRTPYASTRLRRIYLSWSPDSMYLTVLSSLAAAQDLESGVTPVRRQGAYQKVDAGQPYYWDWLPDNRRMVAHVGAERLLLVPTDGLGPEVSLTVASRYFRSPDVSEDGQVLAYVRPGDGGPSLTLRNLTTGEETTLVSDPRPVCFAFSRDSRRVAVLQADGIEPIPYGRLSVLTVENPLGESLTLEDRLALAFFWSPDGRSILFTAYSADGSSAVFVSPSDGNSKPRYIATGDFATWSPR